MSRSTWRLSVDDGTELHVETLSGSRPAPATPSSVDEGGRSGAPVLLLNGITMTTEAWKPLARLLPGRDVVRYDMRGQGASGAPAGPYLRERHAHDLLLLLEDLAGRGLSPLHVVALSNGGYVMQLLLGWLADVELARAAGLPEAALELLENPRHSVASLTLLDTFITVDARMQATVRAWLGALELGGAAARFDTAAPWVWGPDFLATNEQALADARSVAANHPQHAVRSLLEGLLASASLEPDLKSVLTDIDLPLLVALGEDDVLTPARNHREVLEAFGRDTNAMHLIPEAGHAAPIENPAAVAALIAPFLRSYDSPPTGGAAM